MDFKPIHWNTHQEYYKGNLCDLKLFVKGKVMHSKDTPVNLYDENGNFYKTEYKRDFKEIDVDIEVPSHETFEVIQVDYKFYIIPASKRHSLSEGRFRTVQKLIEYGITGIPLCYQTPLIELHHYSYGRTKYEINRPLELMISDEVRYNTKSFMNFDYKEYEKNYKDFLSKYPEKEKEVKLLYLTNIHIICDFYMIDEDTLKKPNFDRLKYAIKALNKKINNKSLKN
jgi:hypothetical protein